MSTSTSFSPRDTPSTSRSCSGVEASSAVATRPVGITTELKENIHSEEPQQNPTLNTYYVGIATGLKENIHYKESQQEPKDNNTPSSVGITTEPKERIQSENS